MAHLRTEWLRPPAAGCGTGDRRTSWWSARIP